MIIQIAKPQTIHEMGNRTNQEDALYPLLGTATAADRVFIVCDGMGGHEKGEVASNTVCDTLSAFLSQRLQSDALLDDRLLIEGINAAYMALDSRDDGSPKRMGTTLTFLCLHRGGVTVAYIGDSRIYHVRPSERKVCMQTRDHSLVYDLYQAGEISYNEMATHPRKNVITKAMQPGGDYRVLPDIVHITDVKPDDYFYLCSDGMLERMTNEQLVEIFAAPTSDEMKAQTLINETMGNADNHTAIFFRVETVTAEPGDGSLFVNDEQTSRSNAVNIKPIVMDVELDATPDEAASPPPYHAPSRPAYPQGEQTVSPGGRTVMPGGRTVMPDGRADMQDRMSPSTRRLPQVPMPSNKILYVVLGVAVVAIAALLYFLVFSGSSDTKDDGKKNGVVNIQVPKAQTPDAKFNGYNDEDNDDDEDAKPEKKELTTEEARDVENFLKTGKPPVGAKPKKQDEADESDDDVSDGDAAPTPANAAPRVPFKRR